MEGFVGAYVRVASDEAQYNSFLLAALHSINGADLEVGYGRSEQRTDKRYLCLIPIPSDTIRRESVVRLRGNEIYGVITAICEGCTPVST